MIGEKSLEGNDPIKMRSQELDKGIFDLFNKFKEGGISDEEQAILNKKISKKDLIISKMKAQLEKDRDVFKEAEDKAVKYLLNSRPRKRGEGATNNLTLAKKIYTPEAAKIVLKGCPIEDDKSVLSAESTAYLISLIRTQEDAKDILSSLRPSIFNSRYDHLADLIKDPEVVKDILTNNILSFGNSNIEYNLVGKMSEEDAILILCSGEEGILTPKVKRFFPGIEMDLVERITSIEGAAKVLVLSKDLSDDAKKYLSKIITLKK
ncbi:MAG: hypothetical protein N4A38_05495 [Candidatus Gracilibacteria bacterium]|nr:hypothetical protein [Candidatus Gracilibacteria bacterium]